MVLLRRLCAWVGAQSCADAIKGASSTSWAMRFLLWKEGSLVLLITCAVGYGHERSSAGVGKFLACLLAGCAAR